MSHIRKDSPNIPSQFPSQFTWESSNKLFIRIVEHIQHVKIVKWKLEMKIVPSLSSSSGGNEVKRHDDWHPTHIFNTFSANSFAFVVSLCLFATSHCNWILKDLNAVAMNAVTIVLLDALYICHILFILLMQIEFNNFQLGFLLKSGAYSRGRGGVGVNQPPPL